MTECPDFLRRLEEQRGKEWMLVGMSIIRTITIVQGKLLDRANMELRNDVSAHGIAGSGFARQLRLAYGLGVIDQKHYAALMHLNKIRNKWAHEEDIDMELKDMEPLRKMLSSEDIADLENHIDTHYGHFRFMCDRVCNRMAAVLEKNGES